MAWNRAGLELEDGTEVEWEAALEHLLEASPEQAGFAQAVCNFGTQASSVLAFESQEELDALKADALAVKDAADSEVMQAAWELLAGHIDMASEHLTATAGRTHKPNETMQAPEAWRLETASELFLAAAEKAWLAYVPQQPGAKD